METKRLHIDCNAPDQTWEAALQEGARLLQAGEVVAFPTETVYGLGANAWDGQACARIFAAKGRPSDNPLIVHVTTVQEAQQITAAWPETAALCAAHFWPGALTLVLPKAAAVPGEVTAGLETIAVRVPSHPVARALIARAGCPVAAPSANISGRPSPTNADHVWQDFQGRIPLVLDAGPCEVGVESTVLDLTETPPVILRPGGVTRESLEHVLGPILLDDSMEGDQAISGATVVPKAPGMKYRHYAPRGTIQIITGTAETVAEQIKLTADAKTQSLAVFCFTETAVLLGAAAREKIDLLQVFGTRTDARTGAACLFGALRACDAQNIELILAEESGLQGLGLAYMNRLRKAAGGLKN